MDRVRITGSNRWFNYEKAERFCEDKQWDGQNHTSVNTGSQWTHQQLLLTKGGTWVLNEWGMERETYRIIDEIEARSWLIRNNHWDEAHKISNIADLEV